MKAHHDAKMIFRGKSTKYYSEISKSDRFNKNIKGKEDKNRTRKKYLLEAYTLKPNPAGIKQTALQSKRLQHDRSDTIILHSD